MHRMTFIDIKSLIGCCSAVFIPFVEGFIVLFGMKETGTLWFSKIWPETNTPNTFFKLKLGIFQILRVLGVPVWGRDEFDTHIDILFALESFALCLH